MPDISWKGIIGFRNIAVHAYFSVDWGIVFVTVTDELPTLKQGITAHCADNLLPRRISDQLRLPEADAMLEPA